MSFDATSEMHQRVGREHRRARIVRATLITDNGEERDVIVRNLSEFGLGITSRSVAPARGDTVIVLLPGDVRVHGTVRWVKGQAFGVALDDQLETGAVEAALQKKAVEPQPVGQWKIEDRHRVHTPRVDPARLRRV